MERFDTMLEAAEFAATRCGGWSFATSNDRYDVKGLLVLAKTSDSEDPIDEDSFYVVSPAGAIGLRQCATYLRYSEALAYQGFLSPCTPAVHDKYKTLLASGPGVCASTPVCAMPTRDI